MSWVATCWKCFTGLSIQTHNDKHVFSIRVCNAKDTLGLVFWFGSDGSTFCIDGCKYKNFVTPNDGRGAAVSFNGNFPLGNNILAPIDGRLRGGGAAAGVWPTPLMPVIGLGFVEIGGKGSEGTAQQGGAEGKGCFHFKGKLAGAAGELVGVEIHLVDRCESCKRRVVLGIVCEITAVLEAAAGEQDGVVARVMRAGVPKITPNKVSVLSSKCHPLPLGSHGREEFIKTTHDSAFDLGKLFNTLGIPSVMENCGVRIPRH